MAYRFLTASVGAFTLMSGAVKSDGILDNLNDAIAAYQEGEIQETVEILEYVRTLLSQKRSGTLEEVLPSALAGWTREDGDGSDNAAAMAMMTAQMGNSVVLAQMGKVKRQKVLLNKDGGLQALVDNRFFVQMEGSASHNDMLAYFEAMDIKGMKEF